MTNINNNEQIPSPVDMDSLLLQQEALKKIWSNPEEDIYELESC